MNILCVNNDSLIGNAIYGSAKESGYQLVFYDAPELYDERSLAELISIIKAHGINVIFSVNYFPQISLACGVLGLKYYAWIVDQRINTYYDYSIRNEWNYIYSADRKLADELSLHSKNVFYLPLAMNVDERNHAVDHAKKDILLWGEIERDVISITNMMPALKDSSKGYIDAMMEQWKNNLVMDSIYDNLADYVKDDVDQTYPQTIDSLETPGHIYDRQYFYPCIEGGYGYPYIYELSAPWHDECTIELTSYSNMSLFNNKIHTVLLDEIRTDISKKVSNYKITVVFPSVYDGTMLTQEMWDIISSDTLVMMPAYINIDLFGERKPLTFKNKKELDKLIMYYLSNNDERRQLIKDISNAVYESGTYLSRINEIFGR